MLLPPQLQQRSDSPKRALSLWRSSQPASALLEEEEEGQPKSAELQRVLAHPAHRSIYNLRLDPCFPSDERHEGGRASKSGVWISRVKRAAADSSASQPVHSSTDPFDRRSDCLFACESHALELADA